MKLLQTLLVFGLLGLSSCQWLEELGQCGAIAGEGSDNEFADEAMQEQVVVHEGSPRAERGGSRSTSGGGMTCFLCEQALLPSQNNSFLTLDLHLACKHAVRSHWRLLSDAEKGMDIKFRKSDPEAWREPINVLVNGPGGKRPSKSTRRSLST